MKKVQKLRIISKCPNTWTIYQYIYIYLIYPDKHFYDCYYYSLKENIKNYSVKLAFEKIHLFKRYNYFYYLWKSSIWIISML